MAPTEAPNTRSARMPLVGQLAQHADLDGAPAAPAGEHERRPVLRCGQVGVGVGPGTPEAGGVPSVSEGGRSQPEGVMGGPAGERHRLRQQLLSCWRWSQAARPCRSRRMTHIATMTMRVSSATMKIPKRTANATSFAASSGRGREKSSAGEEDHGISQGRGARRRSRRGGPSPAPAPLVTVVDTPLVHTSPMVLVAPRQEQAAQAAQAAQPAAARDEVLALLRDGSGQRPRFDPGLSGGLRAWLEDAAAELVARRGEDASPLFLGPRLLWDESLRRPARSGRPTDPFPAEWVRSCLVRALFAQVVTTGQVEDPLGDALDALRVDPTRSDLVRHLDELPEEARAALATSLRIHVENLHEPHSPVRRGVVAADASTVWPFRWPAEEWS